MFSFSLQCSLFWLILWWGRTLACTFLLSSSLLGSGGKGELAGREMKWLAFSSTLPISFFLAFLTANFIPSLLLLLQQPTPVAAAVSSFVLQHSQRCTSLSLAVQLVLPKGRDPSVQKPLMWAQKLQDYLSSSPSSEDSRTRSSVGGNFYFVFIYSHSLLVFFLCPYSSLIFDVRILYFLCLNNSCDFRPLFSTDW